MTLTLRPPSTMAAMLLLTLAFFATTALSETLKAPEGEVILTVTGNVHVTNAMDKAEFDLEMLEALPATEFTT